MRTKLLSVPTLVSCVQRQRERAGIRASPSARGIALKLVCSHRNSGTSRPGIDAFFQLAIQLQHEIVAVVDDGEALVGLLRSGLQVGVDRSPGLAELARVRAYQLAGFAADTPAANDGPQERVAEVAIEGCPVKNRRSLRARAVQPRQHDIGTVVQNRLGLVTGRNGNGHQVDLRIAVAIVDTQEEQMRSGFRQARHLLQTSAR